MGYEARPHDWKTHELESIKTVCVSPPAASLVALRFTTHHRRLRSMNAKQERCIRPSSKPRPTTAKSLSFVAFVAVRALAFTPRIP
jgi:hypothetical protein